VLSSSIDEKAFTPIHSWSRSSNGDIGDACWLNLQEGWWRLFRRDALAGQSFANADEIEQATRVATTQLNQRATPWVWGRPAKDHRHYRRVFAYRI
jgi:hypothetical protein